MNEVIHYLSFSFITMLLASIASGVIGSYVVVKRLSFLSGSIAHSILGGVGIALWLKESKGLPFVEPFHGAIIAALLSAFLIGWIELRFRERKDALIGAIWSTGMALGVIFISMTPGSTAELTHFLFGNILWVSYTDLISLSLLDLLIVTLVAYFYTPFLTLCLDEEQAYIQGFSPSALYLLLLSLIAISIVILMQVIGIILVLALLTLPVMISLQCTKRLFPLMVVSILVTAVIGFFGIGVAYFMNIPIGASIAVFSALVYGIFLFTKKIFTPKKHTFSRREN